MNWGKGILLVMLSFIAFIVSLVVIMIRQDVELESKDYYQREIAFQDEITMIENANTVQANPKMTVQDDYLIVKLDEAKYSNVELNLIRPNDSKLDKVFLIDDTKTFVVNKEELTAGNYSLELRYSVDGKNCLIKDKMYIK